jgi:putative SOS response-associated peptidase YedK
MLVPFIFVTMCYNKAYLTKRLETMAKRYGHSDDDVTFIREQLGKLNALPVYHASGFDHPAVPVMIDKSSEIHLFNWGLIPNWVKSSVDAVKISNTTINARVETIFEKPAFREAARERRCLILVDGFFEHHHKNGKAFPYHIRLKNDEPITMAGLWDEWKNRETGITRRTYTVVTTRANPMMTRIHNNPKASEGSRMPLILTKALERDWLISSDEATDQKLIKTLSEPNDETELESFTVKRLTGKEAIGNKPQVLNPHRYPELETDQTSLF